MTYKDRYKGIAVCLLTLSRCLSGGYVNFGVFQLYGDSALSHALETVLHLSLSIPVITQTPNLEPQTPKRGAPPAVRHVVHPPLSVTVILPSAFCSPHAVLTCCRLRCTNSWHIPR